MSLVRMMDYMYMVINDGKVSWSSDILQISYSTWCSLALIKLATQPIDWVKLILNQLIYMLIQLINKKDQYVLLGQWSY